MKVFSTTPSFKHIEITDHFKYEPRFNGDFSRKNLPRIKQWSGYDKS